MLHSAPPPRGSSADVKLYFACFCLRKSVPDYQPSLLMHLDTHPKMPAIRFIPHVGKVHIAPVRRGLPPSRLFFLFERQEYLGAGYEAHFASAPFALRIGAACSSLGSGAHQSSWIVRFGICLIGRCYCDCSGLHCTKQAAEDPFSNPFSSCMQRVHLALRAKPQNPSRIRSRDTRWTMSYILSLSAPAQHDV